MKTWTRAAGAALLAGSVFLGGFGTVGLGGQDSGRAYAATASDVIRNVISVNGSGEISIKPDMATLYIGVRTEGKTAAEAQKLNAQRMTKLNTLLKQTWGIADKDIQTNQFYVQPNYNYTEKEGQQLIGYVATHTLSVKYRDLSKVGELLDAATNAGANSVDNIQFSVEDTQPYEEQVIAKALANAQMKAGAVAKAANRQLGTLLNVNLEQAQVPFVYLKNELMESRAGGTADSTSFEPGEVKISTQLSAQYEMK